MTYGEAEHERAAVLTYSDVQKYFKLLRRHDYPLRYFAVGEYGSAKGRAHWHVVVFWLKRVPPHEVEKRFLEEHWPHGVSYWASPTYADFRYNCKYIQKDIGAAERQGHLAMSKKPPLGAEYFRRMARTYAEQGLAPKDGIYTFPEAVRRNGARVEFRLSGASEALFIDAYVEAWRELHGDKPMPHSDFVNARVDPEFDPEGANVPEWWVPERKPPVKRLNERFLFNSKSALVELCGRLGAQLGRTVERSEVYWREVANSYVWSDPVDGREWHLRWAEGKGWNWQNPDLQNRAAMSRAEWFDARAAARQTSEPWLIILGRKPRRERPRSV